MSSVHFYAEQVKESLIISSIMMCGFKSIGKCNPTENPIKLLPPNETQHPR